MDRFAEDTRGPGVIDSVKAGIQAAVNLLVQDSVFHLMKSGHGSLTRTKDKYSFLDFPL